MSKMQKDDASLHFKARRLTTAVPRSPSGTHVPRQSSVGCKEPRGGTTTNRDEDWDDIDEDQHQYEADICMCSREIGCHGRSR